MTKVALVLFFITSFICAYAQPKQIEQSTQSRRLDSLRRELSISMSDTAKVWLYLSLASAFYTYTSLADSGYYYTDKAEELSKKMRWKTGEGWANVNKLWFYYDTYNYPKALSAALSGLKKFEEAEDTLSISVTLNYIRIFYTMVQDYANSLPYSYRLLAIGNLRKDTSAITDALFGLGDAYYYMQMPDSSLKYFEEYHLLLNRSNIIDKNPAWSYAGLAKVYNLMNEKELAIPYVRKGLLNAENYYDSTNLRRELYATLSDIFLKGNQYDSALKYAYLSLTIAGKEQQNSRAYTLLSQIYEHINKDSAIAYYKMNSAIKDSLLNTKVKTQLASLTQNELERQNQIQQEQIQLTVIRNRNMQYPRMSFASKASIRKKPAP
jgi:tetratricopeptide (TPR) repeat protein